MIALRNLLKVHVYMVVTHIETKRTSTEASQIQQIHMYNVQQII